MEPIPPPSLADSGKQSRGRLALVLTVALLLGVAQRLEALSWIIPGVANTPGANGISPFGVYFSSDLAIINAGTTTRIVTLSLIPGFGTPRAPARFYAVEAGTTLSLGNVLATVWSITGSGALRVAADGPVGLFASTVNVPRGVLTIGVLPTFGGSLPVIEEDSLLEPGETGHSAWVTQSSDPAKGDRTNVAVVFPDDGGGAATVTLFDDQGTVLGSIAYDAAGPAFLQSGLAAFTAAELSAGRIAITVTRGRACSYTGTIDNGTGDMTIFATDRFPVGSGTEPFSAVSNGVAQTAGDGGAFWQTEARLANLSNRSISVTASLLGVRGQTPQRALSVPPGKVVVIQSLLTSLFSLSGEAAGAVLWVSDGPLLIDTRTSSPVNFFFAQGTEGAGQAAVPLDAFLTPADGPADVGDLRSSSSMARTNLLIAAGPAGAAYTLEARDEGGRAVGAVRQVLPILGWAEFRLSELFAVPQTLRIRVSVESGSVNLQAAVLDQTNDPVLYEASPRGGRTPTPALPPGTWGASDGTEGLKVDATKIVVDRFCRSGTFPQPPRLDAFGRFAVIGDYAVNIGPAFGFTGILSGATDGRTSTTSILQLDGTPFDTPVTYVFGNPYKIAPGPCPIEY